MCDDILFIDNYEHVDPKVCYVKQCILGPGFNPNEFYSYYTRTCECETEVSCSDNSCDCVAAMGKNYLGSLLTPEKLQLNERIYECAAFCSCNYLCSNRLIQKGPHSKLQIQMTPKKGFGVFMLEKIPPGTYICEYAGELIGKGAAANRCMDYKNAKYLMTMREHFGTTTIETYIDAYRFGNIGRYINHSCSPNCKIIPARIGTVPPRAAIFSIKSINRYEEVTYSYTDGYTGNELSETVCYCGSSACAGYLPVNVGPV